VIRQLLAFCVMPAQDPARRGRDRSHSAVETADGLQCGHANAQYARQRNSRYDCSSQDLLVFALRTKVNILSLLAAAHSDYIACVILLENCIADSRTYFLSSACSAFLTWAMLGRHRELQSPL